MICIKNKKQVLKILFVIAIVGIIIYTFRDSAGPIMKELQETSPWIVVLICLSSVIYEMMEGWVTCSLARQYQPGFRYLDGVESAFFCSFYRVATLGSGAGIAGVYYLNQKGLEASKGTGMYMIEYVIHKICTALFSGILFLISFEFMQEHYGDYILMLLAGYGITAVIAVGLLLVCCSAKIHRLLLRLAGIVNRRGRWDKQIKDLGKQCRILEEASAYLLKRRSVIALVVCKNLVKLSFWYGIPFLILCTTGELGLIHAMAITSLAVMLAAVLPAPAGIGSTEFVLTMLLSVVLGTGEAGSVTLLYRFATFVFPFVTGAIVVLLKKRRDRKHMFEITS